MKTCDRLQLASGWELSNDKNGRNIGKKIEVFAPVICHMSDFLSASHLVHQTEGLIMLICKAFYNHFENQWADYETVECSILCATMKTYILIEIIQP